MTTALKSKLFRALGTLNTIQLFDDVPGDVLDRAERRVQELDDKLSVFKPESEISLLNAAAGVKPVTLSVDTMNLLRAGKRFSAMSGGAFSLTTRPLSTLWSLNARCGSVPTRVEIEQELSLVNDKGLILDEQKQTAMLNTFGQAADLGGIAKGYAADEVRRILKEGGVKKRHRQPRRNGFRVGRQPDGRHPTSRPHDRYIHGAAVAVRPVNCNVWRLRAIF